jgi:hypothetical protein
MNNKTAYNPLKRAAAAAWAELSTPEACQWYGDRAWSDTLTAWAALGNVCHATYNIGMFCRVLVEDWLSHKSSEQQQPVALLASLGPINDPEPAQPCLEPTEDDARDAADTGEFIGIEVYLDQEPPELPTVDINKKGNLEVVQQFEADAVVTSPKSKASRPKTNRSSAKKPPTSRRKSSGTAEK